MLDRAVTFDFIQLPSAVQVAALAFCRKLLNLARSSSSHMLRPLRFPPAGPIALVKEVSDPKASARSYQPQAVVLMVRLLNNLVVNPWKTPGLSQPDA